MPENTPTYTLILRHYAPDISADEQNRRVGHVALEIKRNSDNKQEMLISFCDKLPLGTTASMSERVYGVPAQFIKEEQETELFYPPFTTAPTAAIPVAAIPVAGVFGAGIDTALLSFFLGSFNPWIFVALAVTSSIAGFYAQSQEQKLKSKPKPVLMTKIISADEVEQNRERVSVLADYLEVVLTTSLSEQQKDDICQKFNKLKSAAEDGSLRWGIGKSIDSSYRNATCSSVVEEVLYECVRDVWTKIDLHNYRSYSPTANTVGNFLSYIILGIVGFVSMGGGALLSGTTAEDAKLKQSLLIYFVSVFCFTLLSYPDWCDDLNELTALLDGENVQGLTRSASYVGIHALNIAGAFFGSRSSARKACGNAPAHLYKMAEMAKKDGRLPHQFTRTEQTTLQHSTSSVIQSRR